MSYTECVSALIHRNSPQKATFSRPVLPRRYAAALRGGQRLVGSRPDYRAARGLRGGPGRARPAQHRRAGRLLRDEEAHPGRARGAGALSGRRRPAALLDESEPRRRRRRWRRNHLLPHAQVRAELARPRHPAARSEPVLLAQERADRGAGAHGARGGIRRLAPALQGQLG